MTKEEEKKIHKVETLYELATYTTRRSIPLPLREIRGGELICNNSDAARILREQLYP